MVDGNIQAACAMLERWYRGRRSLSAVMVQEDFVFLNAVVEGEDGAGSQRCYVNLIRLEHVVLS